MNESFVSYIVENADIDKNILSDKFPDLPPQIKEHQSVTVLVLQVIMGNKKIICCTAGGKLNSSEKTINIREARSDDKVTLTSLGKITIEVAKQFVSAKSNLILRELNCDTDKASLQRKIVEAISFAKDGDLLVFVGDMAGPCDGKILPLLNIYREPIELPKLE